MVATIISALSKAKGMSLSTESAYTSPLFGIHFLRPMRDLLQKWVLFYLHLKGLDKQLDFTQQHHLKYFVTPVNANVFIYICSLRNLPKATLTTCSRISSISFRQDSGQPYQRYCKQQERPNSRTQLVPIIALYAYPPPNTQ
jgi:hypothetical protein